MKIGNQEGNKEPNGRFSTNIQQRSEFLSPRRMSFFHVSLQHLTHQQLSKVFHLCQTLNEKQLNRSIERNLLQCLLPLI